MDIEMFRRQHKGEQQRALSLAQAAAGPGAVPGKFMVNNTGEALKVIQFPAKFSSIPYLTFGYELLDSENIIPGHLPAITAQVSDWTVEERPPISRLYTGATIRVVSSGPSSSKFIVHWTAQGVVFTNPV